MFKNFFIGILALLIIFPFYAVGVISQENSNSQIVYSSAPIKKGESPDLPSQTRFLATDKIFARAYFPEKFGTLGVEEYGMVDFWIDGIFVKRFIFSNYDVSPSSKEMRLYIHNTGKDDFDPSYYSNLTKGNHKVQIVVGRNQIIQSIELNDKQKTQGKKYIRLAEGNFIFVVQ